jgi:hypothetical protein
MNEHTKLAFHCLNPCGTRFESDDHITGENGIVAPCPACHELAKQAAWQVNLMRTIGTQTGPKTHEGKIKSASNLDGYPTPEQIQLTRFNAMQSGVFAKTASVFPAKPGKYPDCQVCEHFNEHYPDGSDCKPHKACLKKTEVFLLNHLAQETQNPDVLRPLMANFQAGIMSIANTMMLEITQKGVMSEMPQMWFDKDSGSFIPQRFVDENGDTKYITEAKANPLLKVFMEFMHKNGMTLNDLAMTPKVQEEHQIMGGYTKGDLAPEDIAAIRLKQEKQMDQFKDLLTTARSERANDPTLIAVKDENGGDD